jgi:hypothetical protein
MYHLTKILAIFLGFLMLTNCDNGDDDVLLNSTEKKLIGKWNSKKTIIIESGMPPTEIIISPYNFCFMEFENRPAPLNNPSSTIYANTKFVQDNKDCSWLANAWKIENNGKLLLASLDTVHADILKLSKDSLVLKVNIDNYYGVDNHYQAEITYYLTRN